MEINLETLFQEQFKLDKTIQEKHQVTYQDTLIKRILALLVELGECLNETRSFKFWSYKKPSPNEVILEEYVDALHFYLSLGLCLNIDKFVYKGSNLYIYSSTAGNGKTSWAFRLLRAYVNKV